MRGLCLAGLPRLQSFASVLRCPGSCLADGSHAPSTYPVGTMADHTATVFQHCQHGFLGSPILLGLPRFIRRTHSVPVGRAAAPWTPLRFKLRFGFRSRLPHQVKYRYVPVRPENIKMPYDRKMIDRRIAFRRRSAASHVSFCELRSSVCGFPRWGLFFCQPFFCHWLVLPKPRATANAPCTTTSSPKAAATMV